MAEREVSRMDAIEHHGCIGCGEQAPDHECPNTDAPCPSGHHCNHAWTHDKCCYCGAEFGDAAIPHIEDPWCREQTAPVGSV